MIRPIKLEDAAGIAEIYNYYIVRSVATFEEEPVSRMDMQQRIKDIADHYPYIVFEEGDEILGYAYATQWRNRSAYRNTVESSVYLKNGASGRGIGTQLYADLFQRIEALNFHCIIGGISLPNPTSVALHEKFGFKKVAHFREVGFKFNQWVDVGYWEKLM